MKRIWGFVGAMAMGVAMLAGAVQVTAADGSGDVIRADRSCC